MAKDTTTTLEWQVALEDNEWARLQSLTELIQDEERTKVAEAGHPWRRRPFVLAATGALLFSLFVAGIGLWRQAQAGYQQIQADIQQTVEVEGAWLRTEPAPAFWGRAETLETEHFIFHFRQRDRETIKVVAARLDAMYTDLRRDLALHNAPESKLTIDVVIQFPAGGYLRVDRDRLAVSSPLLQTIPENISNADILTKSIVHELVRHTMTEARDGILAEWSLLVHGIQLWEAYNGSNSLPQWQTDVITWLHRDAPAIRQGERAPSVQDQELLCRIHIIWGASLALDPSPSTLCNEPDWRLYLRYLRPSPQWLQELVYLFESDDARNGWSGNWMERTTAATVIEYLVETYGRDRLPVLMANMRRHSMWEELVPATVGVSAAEFEAGWQHYLATRYGR